METIWVIHWRYHDRSECGVLAVAFSNKKAAERMFNVLQDQGMNVYEVVPVSVGEE